MKFNHLFKALLLITIMGVAFSSCKEEEEDTYEVRVRNNAYSTSLGIVPVKYEITEFTIGGTTISEDIPYGEFSSTFSVESGKEYSMSVKYDIYLYSYDTQAWQFDQSESVSFDGAEEWGKGECNPQRITITIKSVFSVPVGANYEVYCEN